MDPAPDCAIAPAVAVWIGLLPPARLTIFVPGSDRVMASAPGEASFAASG
jgi:hypothetical protein